MSCDFSPDNIDFGPLAIGAHVKPEYNWSGNPAQADNGGFNGAAPYYNSKPFEAPDLKPHFSPPIPPQHESANFGQKSPESMGVPSNSPNRFSPQTPDAFSTMAALGLLTDKTIEKFFPRSNAGYAPGNFYDNQTSPINSNHGINSSHCRYPSDSSLPLSPHQQLSPSYAQPGAATGRPSYAPPTQVPSPEGGWTNGFPSNPGQMQPGMPLVKMEWNGFPGEHPPPTNGQMIGPYYRQSTATEFVVLLYQKCLNCFCSENPILYFAFS